MRRVAVAFAVAAMLSACGSASKAPEPSASVAATPSPAASAAAAASAQASTQPLEIVGKFALEPAHGPWDTQVTATASGLKPATKYDLVWTTGNVQWKLSDDRSKFIGRDARTVQNVLQTITTDATGAFKATFAVPQGFGYGHDVMVVDAEKVIRNKSLFDVDMVTTISPTSGPVGTPITVEVKGIGYQSYQNSFQIDYDNAYTGWVSSVTTNGHAKFTIPATGGLGTHYVTLGHAETGAPYLNPQQQPVVAGRPFPHLAFTVTDGPAVLPRPASALLLSVKPAAPVTQGIWTDPGSGIVGAPVTLSGRALTANADLEITWTAMVGNRTVTGFEERTKTIGKVRTDGSGAFAWPFTVPDDLGGLHAVSAKLGDTVVAKTNLYIQANAFPLSVERGPAGTKTVVHLKGVGWTETEQIYHLVYDNAYGGYACAFNSAGDITVNLTVSGEPGWHFIDMYPGIYQGSELHPFNYKMPQLTSDADHPGEPQPIYRFAFLVTAP
jgi:hypothetical protein